MECHPTAPATATAGCERNRRTGGLAPPAAARLRSAFPHGTGRNAAVPLVVVSGAGRSSAPATTASEVAMNYVDGFVLAVPTARREDFRAHAAAVAEVFRECGALRVVECWGDEVPHGQRTDMHMAVQAQADETVVFSWIEWPSKEVRDAGMAKMMADPRVQPEVNPMPFDGKRMIYGGFVPLVDRGE
jgi:uncharacterized protein YbaA (DUF1428 family)